MTHYYATVEGYEFPVGPVDGGTEHEAREFFTENFGAVVDLWSTTDLTE